MGLTNFCNYAILYCRFAKHFYEFFSSKYGSKKIKKVEINNGKIPKSKKEVIKNERKSGGYSDAS